ncbi:MAG: hypothetical protein HY567_03350 [Candidatus Kerfeldbacteria bacterium]|nr:hypothetical protein [Candidatus Kerfeldbacteria bacterium]
MARSSFVDPRSDLGRQLTADVAVLALTLPVVARDAFYQVVLPFVFSASVALVVLFAVPMRDVPFVAQHATQGLSTLRLAIAVFAIGNLFVVGYLDTEFLSWRWIACAAAAVVALGVLAIDLRRIFVS